MSGTAAFGHGRARTVAETSGEDEMDLDDVSMVEQLAADIRVAGGACRSVFPALLVNGKITAT